MDKVPSMADAVAPGRADYDPAAFPPFAVTADLVVLTIRDDELAVLLVRRGEPPFAGALALPGGFVRPAETLRSAARRELTEEAGPGFGSAHLEQLASYGDPGRDPRMRVVTVAYLALAPLLPVPQAGGDAADAAWVPVASLPGASGPGASGPGTGRAGRGGPGLAFDHDAILADGIERARAKLEYTPLATAFCPEEFTVGQLRRVYEIVWGTALDPRNFHRKITGTPGFLEPAGARTAGDRGRPAQLYRRGPATSLQPPMLRAGLDQAAAS
jgi:8-oxo-dGTP diphosphatase